MEPIEALAKYLETDSVNIEQSEYDNNIFEVDDSEYLVCDKEKAEKLARQEIEGLFEDLGLDAFQPEFQKWILDECIDQEFFKDIVRDDLSSYYNDLDAEEIVEKAIEEDLISFEESYDNGYYEETGNLSINPDLDIDLLRQQLQDNELEHIDNYYEYIKWTYGQDFILEFVSDNPECIDIEKIINECLKEDGIAHFIAFYDGEEIELEDGLFAYRLN